ncbi:hypothetical protein DAEQUDRAFT_420351 [Daedalea quercina L-15889]|uniref:Uncharacterized protein n=1 Tax=Daedalea quercina L-15889 TaxID=1314783 RepID=A0A165TL21_9APHY|nr:hypothetical protein DAEQUDRAFT_420351 [Daedalea quercina L-15889]
MMSAILYREDASRPRRSLPPPCRASCLSFCSRLVYLRLCHGNLLPGLLQTRKSELEARESCGRSFNVLITCVTGHAILSVVELSDAVDPEKGQLKVEGPLAPRAAFFIEEDPTTQSAVLRMLNILVMFSFLSVALLKSTRTCKCDGHPISTSDPRQ